MWWWETTNKRTNTFFLFFSSVLFFFTFFLTTEKRHSKKRCRDKILGEKEGVGDVELSSTSPIVVASLFYAYKTHTHTHTMFALQSQIAGAKVVSKVVANKQQRSTVVSAKIAHGKGTR